MLDFTQENADMLRRKYADKLLHTLELQTKHFRRGLHMSERNSEWFKWSSNGRIGPEPKPYTEEELDKYEASYQLTEQENEINQKAVADSFDIKNCSRHKTRYFLETSEFNILPYIDDMGSLPYESARILTFGRKGHYLESLSITTQQAEHIDPDALAKVIAIVAIDARVMNVIMVHNHPHVVAIRPSRGDLAVAVQAKSALSAAGKFLSDSCIVGPMDFYSINQDPQVSNLILNPTWGLSQQTKETLREVNPYLYDGLIL